MKVNFDQPVEGFVDENGKDVALAVVIFRALNGVLPNAGPLPMDQAYQRGKLALKIKKGGEVEMTVEENSLIQSLLPLSGAPNFVIAQAKDLLESATA